MFNCNDSAYENKQEQTSSKSANWLAGVIGLLADDRTPIVLRLLSVFSVLYVLMPLDLIPDFMLGAGQLDDAAILGIAVALLLKLTPEYVVRDHLPIF